MNGVIVRDADEAHRDEITALLVAGWGSPLVVSRGHTHDAGRLPAKVALRDGALVGLATYRLDDDGCELVTLDCIERRGGIGTRLLAAVTETACAHGAVRLWLITSNDNLDAVRFYQRRGMRLVAVHTGAIDLARALKPSIPLLGALGIEIHDELEFEMRFDGTSRPPHPEPL